MAGGEVLHVIAYFRPAFGFGGNVVASDFVVTGLSKMGYKIRVWTSDVADNSGARIPSGAEPTNPISIERYRYVIKPLFKAAHLLVTPRMAIDALVREYAPEIIHLHGFRSFQSVSALALAKRQKVPLLLQPRGSLKIVLGKARLKRFFDMLWGKHLLRTTSRILALSSLEAAECRALGIPESKIVRIPNGVPLPDKSVQVLRGRFRTRYNIDDDAVVILFLGRIRKSKGVHILLDAFDMFTKRFPRSTLVLCGPDEGASRTIRQTASRKGLNVIMPGMITGSEKAEALVDSDIFCLPSFLETQSVALLEAASYGLPIVAFTRCAPRVFVESHACLFGSLSPNTLADALFRLAESSSLRRDLGRRARVIVERHFSMDILMERLSRLYEEVRAS